MKFKDLRKIFVPFNRYKITLHKDSNPLHIESNFNELDKNANKYKLDNTMVNFIACYDKKTLYISLLK